MDAREDANQVIELAGGAVAPIEEELRRRLTVEIGERDAVAIESALLKAFINGLGAGSSEAAELLIDEAGVLSRSGGSALAAAAQPPTPLPRIDPWADRYGPTG